MNAFKTILIPVDFSLNMEVAVRKATQLITSGLTDIHLLHVTETADEISGSAELVLRRIETEIWNKKGASVQTHVINENNVEPTIISFAKSLRPDIIIIGKTNHHSLFPSRNTVISANVVAETGCPVLTVNPASLPVTQTIVMPVNEFFPKRKIQILQALDSKKELNTVHLLSVLQNNQKPDNYSNSALLQIMKSLRSRIQCKIQQTIIHSNNKAIATLGYAEEVNADTLLVSPEAETSITTWMYKKDLKNVNTTVSRMQLLSVQSN